MSHVRVTPSETMLKDYMVVCRGRLFLVHQPQDGWPCQVVCDDACEARFPCLAPRGGEASRLQIELKDGSSVTFAVKDEEITIEWIKEVAL